MRRMLLASLVFAALVALAAGAWAQGESQRANMGPGTMGPGMMGMGPGMMGGQWAQQMQQMMYACLAWMGAQAPQPFQTPAPRPPAR